MKKPTPKYKQRQIRLLRKRKRRYDKRRSRHHRSYRSHLLGVTRINAPEVFLIERDKERKELLDFLAQLRFVLMSEKKSVCIDFTNTKKMFANGTLLFYSELCRLNLLKDLVLKIRCTPPRNAKIFQVLQQIGIYQIVGNPGRTVPATYSDVIEWRTASGNTVEGKKYDDVLGHYDGEIPEELGKGLYVGLTEAMTNCHNHAYINIRSDGLNISNEEKRWWMFSQKKGGKLTVVFCDLGVGIPETLKKTHPNIFKKITSLFPFPKDAEIIKGALNENKTRTGELYRGKGLRQLVDAVSKIKGSDLSIFSNYGCLAMKFPGREDLVDFKSSILGTIIQWNVPLSEESLND